MLYESMDPNVYPSMIIDFVIKMSFFRVWLA